MKILQETDSYIAVYKPAGMAVESRALGRRTLENEMMKYLASKNPGRQPYVAVINRLDQPVEGIVLAAKTQKAAAKLSEQLQAHRIRKHYLAVVRMTEKTAEQLSTAKEQNKEILLTDYLLKDGKTNTTAVVAKGTAGCRRAELVYRVREMPGDGRCLLGINLLTGRHHQIRVQLANAGLPIVGDRKYGEAVPEGEGASRGKTLALCASELVFSDPDNGNEIAIGIIPEGEEFSSFFV
uniref:RluA family pseudouridine synthase n=1 Tax=Eubacterium cellulosolvens TaxID=29322 RepID=UPI000686AB69|nr:RNA pseudouridine synthase [[Eubacterium] cellulosolvens]